MTVYTSHGSDFTVYLKCFSYLERRSGTTTIPEEYSMEDLLDQYLALDWNACGPIQSKQFFRICAPGTQKTPFFQYLSMALSSTFKALVSIPHNTISGSFLIFLIVLIRLFFKFLTVKCVEEQKKQLNEEIYKNKRKNKRWLGTKPNIVNH